MGAELGRADPEDRRKGAPAWRESKMHENERVAIIGMQKESSPRRMQNVNRLSTPQRISNERSELGPFSHADPKSSRFPLLQLLLVGFTQGSADLPKHGLCKLGRHRVSNLLANVLLRELEVDRESLQTCDFPAGERTPATWMVVRLSASASQRSCRLMRIVRVSPAESLPAR